MITTADYHTQKIYEDHFFYYDNSIFLLFRHVPERMAFVQVGPGTFWHLEEGIEDIVVVSDTGGDG